MQAYSNHEVIAKLEAAGCEFGPCQNAYTGLEETVYELTVPTDDATVLPDALRILREFAFKIRCVVATGFRIWPMQVGLAHIAHAPAVSSTFASQASASSLRPQ